MEGDQPDERTRLLTTTPGAPKNERPSALYTTLSVAAFLLLLNVSNHITTAPQIAILEDIVCRQYYAEAHAQDSPAIDRCKAAPIQSEIAFINGWGKVFDCLPAVLLSVPYGALADRIGRKKVLLMALTGCFMNDVWIRMVLWFSDIFPLRIIWLAGLWSVIGAGAGSLSALSYVIVADVCPADQRITAFSQIQTARFLSQFIFDPVGGALISLNPWIPMMISSVLMLMGFFAAVIFIPETLPPRDITTIADQIPADLVGSASKARSNLRQCTQKQAAKLLETSSWVAANIRVVLVLFSFLGFFLGEQAGGGGLLLQYASRRIGWSFSKGSFLLSFQALVNLAVLSLLMPALSSFLVQRLGLHEMAKDKRIAQTSAVFLVLGSVAVFLATSWIPLVGGWFLFSLGSSFHIPARSLIASMVDQKHLATIFMFVSVMTYAGLLAGAPLMAGAFQWGLQLGEFWTGLLFLVAAACFLSSLLAVSVATTKREEEDLVSTDC